MSVESLAHLQRAEEQINALRELAHAHGTDYKTYSRPEAELIVESVAYIVCGSLGLDTASENVPYLAGWNDEQAAKRIKLLAGTIDEIARTIEHAIEAAWPYSKRITGCNESNDRAIVARCRASDSM